MTQQLQLQCPIAITWVLLANDSQAQIFEYDRAPLKPYPDGNYSHLTQNRADSHKLALIPDGLISSHLGDVSTLNPCSSGSRTSNNNRRTAFPPRPSDEKAKQYLWNRFAKTIVNRLHQACAANAFDRLVLIAPTRLTVALKQRLDTSVQKRIVGVLPKNAPPTF